jgi:hypothetical protein
MDRVPLGVESANCFGLRSSSIPSTSAYITNGIPEPTHLNPEQIGVFFLRNVGILTTLDQYPERTA